MYSIMSGFLVAFRQINPTNLKTVTIFTVHVSCFMFFVVPLHVPMAQDGVKELRRLAVDVLDASQLGQRIHTFESGRIRVLPIFKYS